jgi:hypothetical protein
MRAILFGIADRILASSPDDGTASAPMAALVINMMVDDDRRNTGFVSVTLTPLKLPLESMQRSR